MDIEGTIVIELPLQEGISKSNNPWKKKEWVLETPGTFPRKIKFTVFGERRVNDLKFEVGKAYRISVDIESREYNGRWYTDVMAYAYAPIDGGMPAMSAPAPGGYDMQAPAAPAAPQTPFGQPAPGAVEDPFASTNSETDDLPF